MTSVWTSSSVAPSKNCRDARRRRRICVEGRDDLRALVRGQNAGPFQRPREGLRAADIGIDQPPVEMQRAGKALEDFRRSGFKPSAPEFHLDRMPSECRATGVDARSAHLRELHFLDCS